GRTAREGNSRDCASAGRHGYRNLEHALARSATQKNDATGNRGAGAGKHAGLARGEYSRRAGNYAVCRDALRTSGYPQSAQSFNAVFLCALCGHALRFSYHVPYLYLLGRSGNILISTIPATNPPTCAQKAMPPPVWLV